MKKLIFTLAFASSIWADIGYSIGGMQGYFATSGFADTLLNDHERYPSNTSSKSLTLSNINSDNTLSNGIEFGLYTDWFNAILSVQSNQNNFFTANQLAWLDFEGVIPLIQGGFIELDIVPNVGLGGFSRSYGTLGTSDVMVLDDGTFESADTVSVDAFGFGYGINATLKLHFTRGFAMYGKYGYRKTFFNSPEVKITKPTTESTTYYKDGTSTTTTTGGASTTITDANAFDTSSANYDSNVNPFANASLSTSGHYVGAGLIFYFDPPTRKELR